MRGTARSRTPARFATTSVAVLLFVALTASAASAQNFLDPTSIIQAQYNGWATKATQWAQHIYLTLLVFELIALAITTLLFRENIGEFFASFGLKVMIGGVYFWFIDNVATGTLWPKAVIDTFKSFGLSLGGTNSTDWLTAQGLGAAALYAAAGAKAQFLGAQAATLANVPPNCLWGVGGEGYCNQGIVTSVALESAPFAIIMYGMALMIVMAIAAIYLQIILLTIESYLVVGAGVLFIGFAGSRFTMPFSQGYFSYMINVGVKFMVLYIVLGIEQALMPTILGTATAALLLTTPYTEWIAFVPAAVGLVNVVIAAGLVWTIPGFAGSFLSGQSSASGSAVLSQAIGAMSSASGMMAQLHQAKNGANAAHASSAPLQTGQASGAQVPVGANGGSASVNESQQMSPPPPAQSLQPKANEATNNAAANFGTQSQTPSNNVELPGAMQTSFPGAMPSLTGLNLGLGRGLNQISGTAGSSLSPQSGAGSLQYGLSSLDQRTPAQIQDMHDHHPQQYSKELNATDPKHLDQNQLDLVRSPGFAKETNTMENGRAENARAIEESQRAGALYMLAQGAPRDIGQPSAVQVRLANPDKL